MTALGAIVMALLVLAVALVGIPLLFLVALNHIDDRRRTR